MPDDILDLDDGVVDEDAGAERDCKQAHHVEREADEVHDPEGREDRQRQGDCRDEGRPPIAQEQEHHDHGEHGAFIQRVHGRIVVSFCERNRSVDQLELDVGVCRLDRFDLGSDRLRNGYIACAFRAYDADSYHGRAVESGKGARLRNRIGDEAQIVHSNLAAGRQGDSGRRQIRDRLGSGKGADRLVASADLGPPAGEIDVAAAKLPADVERGQAHCL